jgi:hypothetical protein
VTVPGALARGIGPARGADIDSGRHIVIILLQEAR